jgi:NRAMP (natural resistance-associated macrophage protein)-like metal ion transporter
MIALREPGEMKAGPKTLRRRTVMLPKNKSLCKPDSRFKRIVRIIGPGVITGAADDDPSGIATYSSIGAQFGYGMLWTMPLIYPFMAAIQEISARLGRVTGRGIAGNMKRSYPRWLVYGVVALLLFANVINLGADIGAMGAAANLLLILLAVIRRGRGNAKCSSGEST